MEIPKTPEELLKEYNSLPSEKKVEISKHISTMKTQIEPSNPIILTESSNLTPEQDRAERYGFAQLVANHIANTKRFKTFSINGVWGSGKTVLLKWVNELLEKRKNEKIIVIPFNAWEYEHTGNIIFPLIKELKGKAKGIDFDDDVNKVLKTVAILFAMSSIASSIGWGVVIGAIGLIHKIEPNLAKKFDKKSQSLKELKNDFSKLVNKIVSSYENPKCSKIVFLIDELDRCSPENVLTLLESVKNFLGTENTCFVLAIDKKIISKAIASRYGSLSEDDGSEYLEKIIEFSYDLPFRHDYIFFNLLKDYQSEFPMLRSINFQILVDFIKIAEITSVRKIKRILNKFSIASEYYASMGGGFRLEVLFYFVFISEVYPDLYAFIKIYPTNNFFDVINETNQDVIKYLDIENSARNKLIEFVQQTKIKQMNNELKRIIGDPPDKRNSISQEAYICINALMKHGF